MKRCISEAKFELALDNVDAADWSFLGATITDHVAVYILVNYPYLWTAHQAPLVILVLILQLHCFCLVIKIYLALWYLSTD